MLENIPPHSFINVSFLFQLIEPSIQIIKVGLVGIKLFMSCGPIQTWITSHSSSRFPDNLHCSVNSDFSETSKRIFPYNTSGIKIKLIVSPIIYFSNVPHHGEYISLLS